MTGAPDDDGHGVTPPLTFETVVAHLDQNVLVVGHALFDVRRVRSAYFDDYAASDGAFSSLLAMYLDTARGLSTPIARIVDAADVPLSTALYILRVLIEAEQVREVGASGHERYALTDKSERAMHRYLAHALDMMRKAEQDIR